MSYHRDEDLRDRINAFLEQAFDLPTEDYYGRLDVRSMLSLKSALSDINNAVTVRLTLGFLDWAAQTLSFDAPAIQQLRGTVLATKPRGNGYDIHCLGPVEFVAEVKCNIPVNGGRVYGSAQRAGIIKDVDALLHGKSKGAAVGEKCLKFLAFLDLPEIRFANLHLLASSSMASRSFKVLDNNETPDDPKVVYAVYIGFGF